MYSKAEKVNAINMAVDKYFAIHTSETCITVKDLREQSKDLQMIFSSDLRMRKLLRELRDMNALSYIPSVNPIQHETNTSWYFIRTRK